MNKYFNTQKEVYVVKTEDILPYNSKISIFEVPSMILQCNPYVMFIEISCYCDYCLVCYHISALIILYFLSCVPRGF